MEIVVNNENAERPVTSDDACHDSERGPATHRAAAAGAGGRTAGEGTPPTAPASSAASQTSATRSSCPPGPESNKHQYMSQATPLSSLIITLHYKHYS